MPARAGYGAAKRAGGAYDRLTVSQSERDEKRGRAFRHREERLGRLDRDYYRAQSRCQNGDRESCGDAERISQERDAAYYAPY